MVTMLTMIKIWKDIIDRMKNCMQVWKSRKLSYKGKTIIVKKSFVIILWI